MRTHRIRGFFIARLSDDFLTVEKEVCFIRAPLEGGALIHLDGLYYVIGSKRADDSCSFCTSTIDSQGRSTTHGRECHGVPLHSRC